jgi:hypothetical protein
LALPTKFNDVQEPTLWNLRGKPRVSLLRIESGTEDLPISPRFLRLDHRLLEVQVASTI